MPVHTTRELRPQDQPYRTRLHELRRHQQRVQPVGTRRGGCAAVLREVRRAGHHVLGHGQRVQPRLVRGDRRSVRSRRTAVARTSCWHEGPLPHACRPGGSGLSRKAIMENIDASLKRLGTDYVDLYQIHRFDPNTPVEETMEALNDVVRSGKGSLHRGLGHGAWQFSKMQYTARAERLVDRSSRCRTSTTSSCARRSGRCSACSPTRVSGRSRSRPWPRGGLPPVGPVDRSDGDRPGGQALRQDADAADRGRGPGDPPRPAVYPMAQSP